MSTWTHITACLSVETCKQQKRSVSQAIKNYIKNAPKITGSEHDADVYINLQKGHNTWVSRDCEHCPYRDITDKNWLDSKIKNSRYICNPPEDYKCKSGAYQTCIVISIQGDLRDKTKKKTQKEFDAFLKYISKEYIIRDYSLNIIQE